MSSGLDRELTGLEEREVLELSQRGADLRELRQLHGIVRDLEHFSRQVVLAGAYPGKVYELKVDVQQAQKKFLVLKEHLNRLENQFVEEVKEKPVLLVKMRRIRAQVEEAFRVLDEHRV